MRFSSVLLLTALCLAPGGCAKPVATQPTTIYLLRHAEKAPDPGDGNPSLSTAGRRRAAALAAKLHNIPLTAVFGTQYRRTRETVAPLASARDMPITVTEASDTAGLAARIRRQFRGQAVLACGHSNTVPKLIEQLGGKPIPAIEESRFGDLYIVTLSGDDATVIVERFGPAAGPEAPDSRP